MACAQARAVVAVKVFVKQDEVSEAGCFLVELVLAEDRTIAVGVRQEDGDQAL